MAGGTTTWRHWSLRDVRAAPTAGSIMEEHRGAGPGFDHVRIALSLIVILVHSFRVSYPNTDFLYASAFGPIITITLPLFFALSGFLVTGSAIRNRALRVFIGFRALRIVPALAVEITLSALILGPLVTTVTLYEYFTDKRFWLYFLNILGRIRFYLPGVFETNWLPQVNINLWTLHPELECYAVMAALMLTTIAYRPAALTAIWALATVVLAFGPFDLAANPQFGTLGSRMLIYYFVTGVVAFHWRRYIVIHPLLMVAATALVYVLARFPSMTMVIPPLVVYMMVWTGMQRFRPLGFLQRGDYSYGLYLYGFPVQQTLVWLSPSLHHWYVVFILSTALTLGFAMLSWHMVEKPALSLKRLIVPRSSRPPSSRTIAEGAHG